MGAEKVSVMLQVLRIALGLAVAIFVAVAAGAAMGLPLISGSGATQAPLAGIVAAAWRLMPLLGALGLCAVAIAEHWRMRNLIYWLLAGCGLAIICFHALQAGGAAHAAMVAASAPLKFVASGALAGLAYWLIAGRTAGSLVTLLDGPEELGHTTVAADNRRCTICAAAWLLFGLVPFGLLGWQLLHNAEPSLASRVTASAETDGTAMLAKAGLPDLSLKIDGHTGRVVGSVADAPAKTAAFAKAQEALAPLLGLPGVVAVLENDITARDNSDPRVAEEDARIKLAADATAKAEAERVAAEAEAKRKTEEEAARAKAEAERVAAEAEAKRKTEEEAARAKAEAERLAAAAEAKRKTEEEAARTKVEAERLATEAEAKRKAEAEAARAKAEAERVAAEAEAKRKTEEEAASAKAEAERVAAEAEAKRKVEEEAARAKAEAERFAAAAEAKRKAEEEAARAKAEADAQAKVEAERLAALIVSNRKAADDAQIKAETERVAQLDRERKAAAAEEAAKRKDAAESAAATPSRTCAEQLQDLTKRRKIFFKSSSSELRKIHAKLLDAIAALSKRCIDLRIVVSGHTDAQGDDKANQQLSEERAEAVRAALVERGVEAARLEVRGYAARQPSDGTAQRDPRAADRRAEIEPASSAPPKPQSQNQPQPQPKP